MLTTELPTVHTVVTKAGPKQVFSIRGFTSLFAGKLNEFEAFSADLVMDPFQPCEHDGDERQTDLASRSGGPLTQPLPEGNQVDCDLRRWERGLRCVSS